MFLSEKIRNFKRFFILISYIPKNQLIYRLFLIIKRNILNYFKINLSNNKYRQINSFNDSPANAIIVNSTKIYDLPHKINLVGTIKFINRENDWFDKFLDKGSRLELLNLHYMNYISKLKRSDSILIIEDWIKNNPYKKKYSWRYSWNSYALSIRILNWIDYILSIKNKNNKNESLTSIQYSCLEQLNYLSNNLEFDIRGNHIIKNVRSLLRGATYFSEKESINWIKKSLRILKVELDFQILEDGMHFELSPSYHLIVLEDFICIRRSLNFLKEKYPNKISKEIIDNLNSKILKMSKIIYLITHCDNLISLFGDGGLNMANHPKLILKKVESENIFRQEENVNNFGSWELKNSGYYGFKTNKSSFIFDCGYACPDSLPAHGHADTLSFEWSLYGKRLIVDPGTFEYHPGYKRNYSKATSSHNTLNINGLDQSEFWSSFRAGRRAIPIIIKKNLQKKSFRMIASHDGYNNLKNKPTHIRDIYIDNTKLIVNDEVSKGYFQKAFASILFSPNVIIENDYILDKNLKLVYLKLYLDNLSKTFITLKFKADCDFIITQAPWYPNLGESILTSKIILKMGSVPCSFKWSIEMISKNF